MLLHIQISDLQITHLNYREKEESIAVDDADTEFYSQDNQATSSVSLRLLFCYKRFFHFRYCTFGFKQASFFNLTSQWIEFPKRLNFI